MSTFGEDYPEVFKPKMEVLKMGADFGELQKNFKPEEITDDNDFKPLKGAYKARIDRLEHKQGTSKGSGNPYDFYGMKLQITETMEGDKGNNRYLDKIYRNDNEGIKKLLNDMFTSKIEGLDISSPEAFDASLSSIKDKEVKIRTWVWHPEKDRDGNIIPEEERDALQQIKIIKEFKLGQASKTKESAKDSEVPF